MPGPTRIVASIWGGKKRESSSGQSPLLPSINTDLPVSSGPTSDTTVVPQTYGSTSTNAGGRMYSSPERIRRENSNPLDCVPENVPVDFSEGYTGGMPLDEDDWELEQDLALQEEGLYRGSYRNLVLFYTLAPLTSVLGLLLLSILPAYTLHDTIPPSSEYPYARNIPFPIPELLTSVSLWSFMYLLRDSIYALSFSLVPETAAILLSAFVNALVSISLRVAALHILLIQRDGGGFARVWAVGLGWAVAEAVVAVKQGYEGLALYRDVLVELPSSKQRGSPPSSIISPVLGSTSGESLHIQIEREVDELMALKEREELEELYGIPFIHIPIFLSILQRINSLLLCLGLILIISNSSTSPMPLIIAFFIQLSLNALYTPVLLPTLGVHVVVYVALLVGLGTFFAGLGMWNVLS